MQRLIFNVLTRFIDTLRLGQETNMSEMVIFSRNAVYINKSLHFIQNGSGVNKTVYMELLI